AMIAFASCQSGKSGNEDSGAAQKFIDSYTSEYMKLYTSSSEAQWRANTEIREGDSSVTLAAQKADEAMAAFTGSKENIDQARKYLDQKDKLTDIQKKELELILYAAANNPQTVADVVKQR